jgi:hypothetical protein
MPHPWISVDGDADFADQIRAGYSTRRCRQLSCRICLAIILPCDLDGFPSSCIYLHRVSLLLPIISFQRHRQTTQTTQQLNKTNCLRHSADNCGPHSEPRHFHTSPCIRQQLHHRQQLQLTNQSLHPTFPDPPHLSRLNSPCSKTTRYSFETP